MKILIVENSIELANGIQEYLNKDGYSCHIANTLAAAKLKLEEHSFSCVLLDPLLPDGDGMDLISLIRKEEKNTIVILTSKSQNHDFNLLDAKQMVDDFLEKPFYLSELHSRICSINNSKNLSSKEILKIGRIYINPRNRTVQFDDKFIDLSSKEFDLLFFLIINKNRVLSPQSISAHLWGDYMHDCDNFDFVNKYIEHIRCKLSLAGDKDSFVTIQGVGFSYHTDVQTSLPI